MVKNRFIIGLIYASSIAGYNCSVILNSNSEQSNTKHKYYQLEQCNQKIENMIDFIEQKRREFVFNISDESGLCEDKCKMFVQEELRRNWKFSIYDRSKKVEVDSYYINEYRNKLSNIVKYRQLNNDDTSKELLNFCRDLNLQNIHYRVKLDRPYRDIFYGENLIISIGILNFIMSIPFGHSDTIQIDAKITGITYYPDITYQQEDEFVEVVYDLHRFKIKNKTNDFIQIRSISLYLNNDVIFYNLPSPIQMPPLSNLVMSFYDLEHLLKLPEYRYRRKLEYKYISKDKAIKTNMRLGFAMSYLLTQKNSHRTLFSVKDYNLYELIQKYDSERLK